MRRNAALSIDYLDHMPAYNEETDSVSENDGVHTSRVENPTTDKHRLFPDNTSAGVLHTLSPDDTTIQPVKSPALELIDRLRQELAQNQNAASNDSPSESSYLTEDISPEKQEKPSLTAWQRLEQDLKAVKDNKKVNKAVEGWLEQLRDERQKNQEILNIGQCQEAIHAATTAVDTAEKNAVDHEKRLQNLTKNLQRLVDFLDSGDHVIVKAEQEHTPHLHIPTSQAIRAEQITQQLEQTLRNEFLPENNAERHPEKTDYDRETSSFQKLDTHKVLDASEAMSLMFHGTSPVAPAPQILSNAPAPSPHTQPAQDNPFAAFYGVTTHQPVHQVERLQTEHAQPTAIMQPSNPGRVHPKSGNSSPRTMTENRARKIGHPATPLPQRGISQSPEKLEKPSQPSNRGNRDVGNAPKNDLKIRPPSEHRGSRRPRMQHAPLPEEQIFSAEPTLHSPLESNLSQEINFSDFSIEPEFFSKEKQERQIVSPSSAQPKIHTPKTSTDGGNKKVYIFGTLGFLLVAALTAGGLAFGLPNLSEQAPVNTASVTQDKRPTAAPLPAHDNSEQATASHTTQGKEEAESPADESDIQVVDPKTTSSIAVTKPRVRLAEIGSLGELPMVNNQPSLRDAALDGDAFAVYELAHRLEVGQGVVRDVLLSAKLFLRAAEQGFVPAQTRVAHQFEKGIGMERDPGLAREWYRRAAEAGNVKAMHQLAMTFAQGIGGPTDYASATLWFKRAAKFGYKDSQFNFAILASKGLGMKPSLVQAYTHFAAAAQQGDKDAANKRDEVGSRLGAEDLAFARKSAEQWRNQTPDPAANDVPEIVL